MGWMMRSVLTFAHQGIGVHPPASEEIPQVGFGVGVLVAVRVAVGGKVLVGGEVLVAACVGAVVRVLVRV